MSQNLNPTSFSISCSIRSPKMLTSNLHWEPNSIAFWDDSIVTHNAIFDFWPQTRYALKATPHGETLTQILGFRLGNLAS
ncbi:hypothetical protein EDD22DRAFT_918099 [Suillus occidentalis]|nr:hypothetical protein EDD22DRAFT_918099 [Suillus occidentalis]